MRKFDIELRPYGNKVSVSPGTTLLEAARLAHVPIDAPCGGNGTCGKCMVRILDGETPGFVQACRTQVHADLTVELPQSGQHHILTGTQNNGFKISPMLRRVAVDLPRGVSGDQRSLWQRFKERCGAPEAPANIPLVANLPDTLAALNGNAEAVLYDNDILDVRSSGGPLVAMAFDLGTTTIVGWLLDAQSGKTLAVSSMLNPQSQFGADVVQRANYALLHGTAPLTDVVRRALNTIVEDATRIAGLKPADVYLAALVGNTCMHHLFMGLSPASLVLAPYHPALSEPLTLTARDYINIHPNGKLLVLPNIAGFVGSDTVGVMLAAGFDRFDEPTLAIDIGTNGELVLGDRRGVTVCSTAAGPAFEGATISSGMRGTTGAIDHIRIVRDRIRFSVIGDGAPKGICGSGLMDLMAGLLSAGVVDPSGRFVQPADSAFAGRYAVVDGNPAFEVAPGVVFTQRDVREVQLAKAAMAAGVRLLLKKMGMAAGDIRRVLIAGAFGNSMYPASACRIGLIPPELEPRVVPVGNAAGMGAQMAVLSGDEWRRAAQLASSAQYLDLTTDPDFEDCFVDELAFPEIPV
jgi:uncharacterized 2Fe-2S/4Fe-4S cluster protein (DUF4445 family)